MSPLTRQSCNEATFATSWRTIEKISSSIRDSTWWVPLWAVDKVVDIVEQTFWQAATEHDRRKRATSARMTKLSPLSASCRKHDSLAFLLRQCHLSRTVQYVHVQLVLTAECCQCHRLPWYSCVQVQHLLLTVPLNTDPVILVLQEVSSWAWNEFKLCYGFSMIYLKPNITVDFQASYLTRIKYWPKNVVIRCARDALLSVLQCWYA